MNSITKKERTEFNKIITTETKRLLEKDPDATVWDAIISLFSKYENPYILYLKADFPILEKLTDGFSVASVANSFSIPSKDVYEVAQTWGITPLDFTLDFDPLLVYNSNMTLTAFMTEMGEYLPIPIKRDTASIVYGNLKRYYELLEFLEEEENG